jgi:enoyl-CoA hydratase/carnithine racemase
LIQTDKIGHVAVITMQGSNDLNLDVVGPELYASLGAYLADGDLRCAVVTGHGTRAFSAGGDIKKFAGTAFDPGDFWSSSTNPLNGTGFWKPLVGAVNGHALGSGMMLALACDLVFASSNATFGLPEVKYGFPPGLAATQRLPRRVGLGPALEMLLTGDSISAAQAERWCFVNRILPQAELVNTAIAVAQRIAANPPLAVRGSKELAWRALDTSLEEGIRLEEAITQLARNSEDAKEGPLAYQEKREPKFIGR